MNVLLYKIGCLMAHHGVVGDVTISVPAEAFREIEREAAQLRRYSSQEASAKAKDRASGIEPSEIGMHSLRTFYPGGTITVSSSR